LPHTIRHTVGTSMALNGAPLLIIQQYLGHSDPKTTLRYIRRADEVATRAYRYKHSLKTTAPCRAGEYYDGRAGAVCSCGGTATKLGQA